MAFSSPCTRLDGVGSGHFIRLDSTHCMIASPFLRLVVLGSRGRKKGDKIPAVLLLEHIEMHLVVMEVVVGVKHLRDGLIDAG